MASKYHRHLARDYTRVYLWQTTPRPVQNVYRKLGSSWIGWPPCSAFLFSLLKCHHIRHTKIINKNCVATAHQTPVR